MRPWQLRATDTLKSKSYFATESTDAERQSKAKTYFYYKILIINYFES